jgi:hypothetical protein
MENKPNQAQDARFQVRISYNLKNQQGSSKDLETGIGYLVDYLKAKKIIADTPSAKDKPTTLTYLVSGVIAALHFKQELINHSFLAKEGLLQKVELIKLDEKDQKAELTIPEKMLTELYGFKD